MSTTCAHAGQDIVFDRGPAKAVDGKGAGTFWCSKENTTRGWWMADLRSVNTHDAMRWCVHRPALGKTHDATRWCVHRPAVGNAVGGSSTKHAMQLCMGSIHQEI